MLSMLVHIFYFWSKWTAQTVENTVLQLSFPAFNSNITSALFMSCSYCIYFTRVNFYSLFLPHLSTFATSYQPTTMFSFSHFLHFFVPVIYSNTLYQKKIPLSICLYIFIRVFNVFLLLYTPLVGFMSLNCGIFLYFLYFLVDFQPVKHEH